MTLRNTQERWGWLAQFMHWSTALLILITFPIGWWANSLERGPAARALFNIHFATGALIFVIVVARLAWRIVDAAPNGETDVGRLLRRAAKFTHMLLYAGLIVAVISGYVIQVHMRPTLDVFGLVQVPRPFEPGEDESLRALAWYVHIYSVWGILGLVLLHAGAALWHHFVLRDQILSRMMPGIIRTRQVRGQTAEPEQDLGRAV